MNKLQIILVCVLAVLGITFLIVLYVRFSENARRFISPSKKKINCIVTALKKNISSVEQWDLIWPSFYKNGKINYAKIDSILIYIINHEECSHVRAQAVNLLKERISVAVYGLDELTESIDFFRRKVDQCGNQDVKDAGNELIRRVQRFCRATADNKRIDMVIQWIFNAIEVVGLILAIISL